MQNLALPSMAEMSLAVIAAAFVIAVIVLVPVLIQVRRTARRAEVVLAGVGDTLPGLLTDLRTLVGKLDGAAAALQTLAGSVERWDGLTDAAARTVEGMRESILPSVATAAGLLAALREGVQWIRPRRDRGRDE